MLLGSLIHEIKTTFSHVSIRQISLGPLQSSEVTSGITAIVSAVLCRLRASVLWQLASGETCIQHHRVVPDEISASPAIIHRNQIPKVGLMDHSLGRTLATIRHTPRDESAGFSQLAWYLLGIIR